MLSELGVVSITTVILSTMEHKDPRTSETNSMGGITRNTNNETGKEN